MEEKERTGIVYILDARSGWRTKSGEFVPPAKCGEEFEAEFESKLEAAVKADRGEEGRVLYKYRPYRVAEAIKKAGYTPIFVEPEQGDYSLEGVVAIVGHRSDFGEYSKHPLVQGIYEGKIRLPSLFYTGSLCGMPLEIAGKATDGMEFFYEIPVTGAFSGTDKQLKTFVTDLSEIIDQAKAEAAGLKQKMEG